MSNGDQHAGWGGGNQGQRNGAGGHQNQYGRGDGRGGSGGCRDGRGSGRRGDDLYQPLGGGGGTS